MPSYLQTSGAISLANLQTFFGGSNPIAINEYYLGGTYVPSYGYGTVTTRTPTSGSNYSISTAPIYYWSTTGSNSTAPGTSLYYIYWNGSAIFSGSPSTAATVTSYTVGSTTYYRDSYQMTGNDQYAINFYFYYRIYSIYTGTGYGSINQSIPASGTISLSHFYGASNGAQ